MPRPKEKRRPFAEAQDRQAAALQTGRRNQPKQRTHKKYLSPMPQFEGDPAYGTVLATSCQFFVSEKISPLPLTKAPWA